MLLLFFASLLVFLSFHDVPKKVFQGQGPPDPPRGDGTEFAKGQNFFLL